MRTRLHALVPATLLLVGSTSLIAQDRDREKERDQERESRRRTVWVSRDDDRPRLGISTSSGSRRDTLGLLVTDVVEGGAADKAGIEDGDRIASINGVNLRIAPEDAGDEDMANIAQRRLIRELEKHKAGDEVELRVYSNGSMKTVKAKLTEPGLGVATTLRERREEMENRAVLGLGLGSSGSRRDTLGILVTNVSDDGPAEKAGVEEGDRLVSINGVDLRVAKEDAGDWSSTSSRIRRLNRAMEKVKPGEAVDLRVYRDGQQRSIRVTAGKASEMQDRGGFFFGDGMGFAMPRIPRAPEAPMPPMPPRFQWNDDGEMRIRVSPKVRADVEDGMRGLERGLIELRRAIPRVRVDVDDGDDVEETPPAATTLRARPTGPPGPAIAGFGGQFKTLRGGPRLAGPAVGVWAADGPEDGTVLLMGLRLAKVERELAEYYGAGSERGLLVLDADQRWDGVRGGDVILRMDGNAVRPDGSSVRLQWSDGSEHTIDLLRGGKPLTVRATISEP
ncbi:MAG: PDZ domain-containing protein [Gemmatimonadaceae bacterium]